LFIVVKTDAQPSQQSVTQDSEYILSRERATNDTTVTQDSNNGD